MSEYGITLFIVSSYFVNGILLILASDKIAGFFRRLGTKPMSYARVSLRTFGACVAVLGAFGISAHLL